MTNVPSQTLSVGSLSRDHLTYPDINLVLRYFGRREYGAGYEAHLHLGC